MQLRDYQIKLDEDSDAAWAAGARNVLAVSATGSGKTVFFAHKIRKFNGASVAIAHRQELVSQMSLALARSGVQHRIIGQDSLRRACSALHMAEVGRNYVNPNARCAAAGVDTLVRMPTTDPWFASVGLWVTDEAHHLLGGKSENKWGKAVGMFPNARGLGVTATPCRADGKGLGRHADGVMDAMVLAPGMRDLIERRYLTDYRIFAPPSDLDLSDVPTSADGDFSQPKLRSAVHKSHITGDVVQHYQRIAAGKLGVTFAVDVEAATEIAAAFRAAGVPSEVVSAKTPDQLRAAILRRFRNREVMQLVNVDLFGEGFDLPAIEVVSMARPTQSFSLFSQQFGRALRLMDGKERAIILDHVGNVLRHGLPDAPRVWTLDRRDKRSRAAPTDVIPVRTCPQCTAAYERIYRECPFCGYYPEPAARSGPEHVDGDLGELDPAVLATLRGEAQKPVAIPYGASPEVVGACHKRHRERREAQAELQEVIAWWAGLRQTMGDTDSQSYRRFYHQFGVDVATAQTLPAREASELTGRVVAVLRQNNVDGFVNNG